MNSLLNLSSTIKFHLVILLLISSNIVLSQEDPTKNNAGFLVKGNMPTNFPFFHSNYIPVIGNKYALKSSNDSLEIIKPNSYIKYNFTFIESETKDYSIYTGDNFIGQVSSNDPEIGIVFLDNRINDKDEISVNHNGKFLAKKLELTNKLQGVSINLDPGFNTIEIKSISEGNLGYTTGEFGIYTISGNLVKAGFFNLSKGAKIQLIIDRN